MSREPARLIAIDGAQPEIVAPLVGFHVGVTYGIDDQVSGGRDGGCPDPVDADQVFRIKVFGGRGRNTQAREGKTNNLARHLYSSYRGKAQ